MSVLSFFFLSPAGKSFPRRSARQRYRSRLYQFLSGSPVTALRRQRLRCWTPFVLPFTSRFILPGMEEETHHEDMPLHAQAGRERSMAHMLVPPITGRGRAAHPSPTVAEAAARTRPGSLFPTPAD